MTIDLKENMKPSEFDGMKALIDEFGDDGFIRLVVENSYFFDENIVAKRLKELKEMKTIPARKTTKNKEQSDYYHKNDGDQFYYCDGDNTRILINIDYDGNKEVRRLIKQYTGYSIGAGKTSDFQKSDE